MERRVTATLYRGPTAPRRSHYRGAQHTSAPSQPGCLTHRRACYGECVQGDAPSDPLRSLELGPPPADGVAWHPCGEHRFCIRGDVLHWEAHGAMNLDQLQRLFAERQAVQLRLGRSFLVIDARDLGSVPPENRRYAIHYRPDPPFRGATVIFGGNVIVRTAVSLITAAARLIGRGPGPQLALHFVADEPEAAKIIERQRRTLAADEAAR